MRRDFSRDAVVAAIRSGATNGQRRVSIATLCDETGLCRNAVRTAITRAVDAHQLARIDAGAGGRDAGLYRLVNGARNGPEPTLLNAVRTAITRDTTVVSDPVTERTAPIHNLTRSESAPLSFLTGSKTGPDGPPPGDTGTLDAVLDEVLSARRPPGIAPLVASAAAPSAPARRRPPARASRPLFDAVCAAWLGSGVTPGKNAGAVVAMAEREIAGYGGTPEQVPERWEECCRRFDEPTPLALAKHWLVLDRPARRADRQRRVISDQAERLAAAGDPRSRRR